MKWRTIEDQICSLVFLKNHILKDTDINTSVDEALQYGVDKTEGSIKMKFGNIAAICDELDITVRTRMGRLSSYSRQLYKEFHDVMNYSLPQIDVELEESNKNS
jgi:hypothetical protein